jgi:hypothetical protein
MELMPFLRSTDDLGELDDHAGRNALLNDVDSLSGPQPVDIGEVNHTGFRRFYHDDLIGSALASHLPRFRGFSSLHSRCNQFISNEILF